MAKRVRVTRPAAVTVALLVLATSAIAAVSKFSDGTPGDAAAYAGNARRFLDLTDESSAASERGGSGGRKGGSAAAAPRGNFTPAGWRIRPAGQQVPVFNFPLGLASTGDSVFVSSDSGGMQGITTIDVDTLRPTPTPAANLFIGMSVTEGGRMFASGGNADRLFRYRYAAGQLVAEDATESATFPNHSPRDGVTGRIAGQPQSLPASDGIRVPGYPGASLLDGEYLYVAGTLAEPAAAHPSGCPGGKLACSRVSVVDTRTDTLVARAGVGMDAYGLALDPLRRRLYVSNWADEAGRGNGVGTVSVLDVTNPLSPLEVSYTPVGHHPSAVQLSADRTRLFVADTNDDAISVLDVSGEQPVVIATESVRPTDGLPVGAHPVAFALAPDGETMFVALAGMNAVEVRDGRTAARVAGRPMYIPTGWYPSALLVTGDADRYQLWVANAKGSGAARRSTGMNMSIGHELPPFDGTVSVIDLPAPAAKATKWTEQVVENDHLDDVGVDPCRPGRDIAVSEVLCPPTGTSPVKHVVYIVTENKTFDQYFGDLDPARYDADPKYLLYGQPFTPNHHSLASRFSLSDRFFSDAQVSVTGHSWTSGAVATDHNEKTFEANYDEGLRGKHGTGDRLKPGAGGDAGTEISEAEEELDDPEGGFVFEAFARAGAVPPAQAGPGKLSMAIYGESTARESGDMSAYKAPQSSWGGDLQYFDTCRAELFVHGAASDGPFPSSPEQFADCGGRTIPSQFSLKHWTDVYAATGEDVMPNFIYMTLPVNHTLGTNLGSPTPASMVADNDYALGLIVEALSKSPFWESTVVMQTEDDTQAAGDHISPLRDYLLVAGPWAAPRPNHQWGSMPSLLRTIEQLFGVRPISLHDRLALPQHGAFRTALSGTPDTRPYEAIKPLVPFALNGPGAPGQAESEAMDWSTYDLIDEQTLNAILYAVARGVPFVKPQQ